MPENWSQYVHRVTQGIPQKDIAAATGVDQTGISRWIRGLTTAPRADSVVAFARGLDLPPVGALVAAGYLRPEEAAAVVELRASPDDLSDTELVREVESRLARVKKLAEANSQSSADHSKGWSAPYREGLDRALGDQEPGMGRG